MQEHGYIWTLDTWEFLMWKWKLRRETCDLFLCDVGMGILRAIPTADGSVSMVKWFMEARTLVHIC